MRDAIAIIMAILGTVLVLSGAAALWAAALATARNPEIVGDAGDASTARGARVNRSLDAVSRLPAPDRLIIWGIVLLALSAVAVGAITFGATATAGTR
jgi:hypothetical protein